MRKRIIKYDETLIMKKSKQWDVDDTYGSNIHGLGSAWGDMRGKVKTKQIGFVRNDKPKTIRRQPTHKTK